MIDLTDEKNTNAWVASIWKENDGDREWPQVLRPQRPEHFELSLKRKYECAKGVEANRIRNKDLEILDQPPVFLKIKDLKKKEKDILVDVQ